MFVLRCFCRPQRFEVVVVGICAQTWIGGMFVLRCFCRVENLFTSNQVNIRNIV